MQLTCEKVLGSGDADGAVSGDRVAVCCMFSDIDDLMGCD